MNVRTRAIISQLTTYLKRNKKVVISLAAAFFIALIVGIIMACREVNGEFERVARVDCEIATGKIFFISVAMLVAGYGLILISGLNGKTVIISVVPFIAFGFLTGRYSCALIGRYEVFGAINLLFIYLPFFFITAVLMIIATVSVLSSSCTDRGEKNNLKPSFIKILKLFGINFGVSFVLFIIVGSICGGVIKVALF